MKINPLDPRYMKGYNDGHKAACNRFADGFEKLQKEKGIGEKTMLKIIEAMGLSNYVELKHSRKE